MSKATPILKTCPFCGGVAHVRGTFAPARLGVHRTIRCARVVACGAYLSPLYPLSRAQIVALWNTRKIIAATKGRHGK